MGGDSILDKAIFNDEEFISYISDILQSSEFDRLKQFRHHVNCTRWEHSVRVAYKTYQICNKFRLETKKATGAALLHDFFLYDWKKDAPDKGWHPRVHSMHSWENARRIIETDEMMKDCIVKHMWPMTLAFPRFKESWVVQYADKACTIGEIIPENAGCFLYSRAMMTICMMACMI